jgi:hypothetical protein
MAVLVATAVAPLLPVSGIAFADEPAPCVAPSDSQSGVHRPTGSDAGTFTYQCDGSYAGMWTNQYYVYNPANGSESPLFSRDYSYDCATTTWIMTTWNYSPARQTFVQSRVTASPTPVSATNCPVAQTPTAVAGQSGISTTGPNSNNTTSNTASLNGTTTNNTTLGMSNGISGAATTGNTLVVGNTSGGSAASGDAQTIANVANLLQSTSNAFGPGTAMFTANINGNVNGDFMFDPSAILNTGPNSNNAATNNLQVHATDTADTNAQINNTIDVGAASGDATVTHNTAGGNATTGNAQSIVNLMNLINSTVTSGQSFIGTININGDLNGDILLPQGVLDQLLASTGPTSNNSTTNNLANTATTTNTTTEGITNAIHSTALSGDATVSGNTSAGSASTGTAGTNVTLLNLTGSSTIGKNDLLVFVNVLGKWVGMIMNAPAGSTAASLGGGITGTGPNSNNATSNRLVGTSTTTNTTNLGINNNVNVNAKSGAANVTDNTLGGNATTGTANTAVNILNLAGSNLDLSNWFGILFINVFGIWNGSFGVNTSAGDPAANPSNNPVQAATQTALQNSFRQIASFAASGSGSTAGTSSDTGTTSSAVLGTATTVAKKVATTTTSLPTPDNSTRVSYLLPAVGVLLAGAILLISERSRFFGNKQ